MIKMEWKEILIKSGLAGLAGAIGEFLASWDLSWTTFKVALIIALLRGVLVSIASIQGNTTSVKISSWKKYL